MARAAYDYALELLAIRAYTTRNLQRKLIDRDYPDDEVAAAVERLQSAGLLDDERYAQEYARQKLTFGSASVRRVQQDLLRRGVASALIQSAIDSVMADEPVDIDGSIERLVRRKLASMGELETDVRRRRLFAFLARRGFDLDDISRSIERHLPRG